MLRRVNVRQVMAFDGMEMSDTGAQIAREHKQRFKRYKQTVREEIDNPMPERVAPAGTRPPDVYLECHEDGKTFGRQLRTYPLLVAVPGERELGQTIDVTITGYGYRSVTGMPHPLDLNSTSMDELTAISGLGQRHVGTIIIDRPHTSTDDITEQLDVDLEAFATVEQPGAAD